MTLLDADRTTWAAVSPLDRLVPGRGVAALVAGKAVAVFLLADGSMHAVDDIDPCSGASVLSRGLVGETDVEGAPVRYVASPIRKQRFDLASGCCLDGDAAVDVWAVRVADGIVQVGVEASRWSNGPETNT